MYKSIHNTCYTHNFRITEDIIYTKINDTALSNCVCFKSTTQDIIHLRSTTTIINTSNIKKTLDFQPKIHNHNLQLIQRNLIHTQTKLSQLSKATQDRVCSEMPALDSQWT